MVAAAVLGSGSWGTAFAQVLADAGTDVVVWSRRAALADEIERHHRNPDYLAGIDLNPAIRATADAREALAGARFVVLAVPSQTLRANLAGWAPDLPTDATVVSMAKGVESDSLLRMSEVVVDVAGVAPEQVAVVSGPNLAGEIARRRPAATVVACADEERAVEIQKSCATNYFRPYTNTDVIGAEIGGACKNVIALACGMAAGLDLGENAAATTITRGLAEIIRLGTALGADPATFAGLAGVGDLVATCTSPLSRNRSFGERLGRGETVEQAQHATHGQVAEGVRSCTSVRALAERHGVEMPLTDAVHRVCHEGLSVSDAVELLFERRIKPER